MTRYRIDATIGVGRLGPVWRATPERLGAVPVAVRDLPIATPQRRARLRFDAERLALVGHPGLVLVEDVEAIDDDTVRVASTLGDGGSMADRLTHGPLPLATAADVLAQVAAALDAAHGAGLSHRSLSDTDIVFRGAQAMVCDVALADALADATPAPGQDGIRLDCVALAGLARDWIDPFDQSPDAATYRAVCDAVVADPPLGLTHLATAHQTTQSGAAHLPPPPTLRTAVAARPSRVAAVAVGVVALLIGVAAGAVAGTRNSPASDAARPVTVLVQPAGRSRPGECPPPDGEGDGAGPDRTATTVVGAADVDGDGCVEDIGWDPTSAIATWTGRDGTRRVRVGEVGDQALVGDWDCDGAATLGLYRPSTGETFLFAGWARPDAPLDAEAGPALSPDAVVGVSRGDPAVADRCDRITAE